MRGAGLSPKVPLLPERDSQLGLADYSQVDWLASRYKFVNFEAGTSLGEANR